MSLSRQKRSLLIFAGMLLVVVLFTVFYLFFNKGTLQILGQIPFTVEIEGTSHECEMSPCEISLMKGRYQLNATKEGYRSESAGVVINRGSVTELSLLFEFVPQVERVGDQQQMSVGDLDLSQELVPLDLDEALVVRPVPSEYSEVAFSADRSQTFFYGLDTALEGNFFLDLEERVLKKLNLGDLVAYEYAPQSSTLYFVRVEENEEGDEFQSLNSFVPGKITPLANFMKPLDDVRLFVSHDEDVVMVYDSKSGEMFKVNLHSQSRTKIMTKKGIRSVEFSPNGVDMMVGVSLGEDNPMLAYSLYNLNGKKRDADLKIVAEPQSIVFRDGANVAYGVLKDYSPKKSGINALLEGGGVFLELGGASSIVNYNIDHNKYTVVYDSEEHVYRVELDARGDLLFGQDNEVWKARFSE